LALENVSQIDQAQYIDGLRTKMLDLTKELEARLDAEASKEQHEA